MTKVFDFCVVGGGMIGSATALGLANLGYQIAIVEKHMPAAYSAKQPPDMRVSAINLASQRLLNELEAWRLIEHMRLCPFRRMDVYDNKGAVTHFNANEIGTPYLGHIIENRIIQLALHNRIKINKDTHDNIQWFVGQSVASLRSSDQQIKLTLTDGTAIQATYIVGADGGNSQIRRLVNIGEQGWQYGQQALAIKVQLKSGQQDITWQEFHPSGPRAFLPLFDSYASLVWYDSSQKVNELKNLNTAKLKAQIVQHFPDILDDFDILEVTSFPLTRMHANQYVKDNVVLIGDAAHTINPMAGQGVNLGFKDVQVLLNSLAKSPDNIQQALFEYEKQRRLDNLLMMSAMDGIYQLFSNAIGPVSILRNIGLAMADKAGPIKKQVMKYAMGID